MVLDLVDYESQTREAVKEFWGKVASGHTGEYMDGFQALILDLERANGLPDAQIYQRAALPGSLCPTTLWDVVIVHRGELVAAVMLKSQIGPSFADDFGRQVEQAVSLGHELWAAYRGGAFGQQPQPFAGWLMLVEDTPASRSPVRDCSPHFSTFPEFNGASYLQRYDLLCQKLVREQLYTHAALIASPRSAIDSSEYSEVSAMSGLKPFVTALAGHVAAEAARLG